jgi:Bacterial PH domain
VSRSSGEQFALTARPPVRALAIASVTTLLGAVLLVLAQARGLGLVLLIIGSALLVFGLTLGLIAILLVFRLRSRVVLDGAGVTLYRGGRSQSLAWSAIDRVDLEGPRLSMISNDADRPDLVLINPRTPTDQTFLALVAAVQKRLDADRGYRTS